jgi:hypothetical protein
VITQEQIEEAEKAVEAAETRLDAAEGYRAKLGSETSDVELDLARAQAHLAHDELRRIRAAWRAQEDARAQRAVAEAEYALEAPAVAAELDLGRLGTAQGSEAVRRAVRAFLVDGGAYNARVRGAGDDLRRRGLVAGEGQSTGVERSGIVRLADEPWYPVDTPGLLAVIVAEEVEALHPRHHVATANRQAACRGGHPQVAARKDLLGRLPEKASAR